MVAYSFRPQFVQPILSGAKRQTIRPHRAGRSRHARPGEEVQLYTGMRTRRCTLIGRAMVESVHQVELMFSGPSEGYVLDARFTTADLYKSYVNTFARADGFKDWRELKAFWAEEHPGLDRFEGVLIKWRDFKPAGVEPGISKEFDAALDRAKTRTRGYGVRR